MIYTMPDGRTFDDDLYYRVDTLPGFACYIVGLHEETAWIYDEEMDCEVPCTEVSGMLLMVMKGDDRTHIVDPDDLTPIHDDVCSCGQIGCRAEG